jgi:hypothetical protein
MDETVARILDDAYVADLGARPIEDVRAMRSECQEIETGLSYLRRVVQGRLDIVHAELSRRRSGGSPGDLASLVEQLPEILGDHLRAPGNGRLPVTLEPSRIDPEFQARFDEILAGADVDAITTVDEDRLAAAVEELTALEHDISERRRALFDRIDQLQAEITRRYKTGEASVESLLK